MKKSVTFLLCLYHLTTAGKLEIVPIIITVICNTLSNFSAENHKLLVALGNDELDMEIIDLKKGSSCQVDNFVPESFMEANAIGFLHENDNVVGTFLSPLVVMYALDTFAGGELCLHAPLCPRSSIQQQQQQQS